MPVVTVIKGDIDAVFGAGVKQPRTFRVFAHRVNVIAGLDAVDDLCPALSIVIRAKYIRRAILLKIIFHGDVSRARFVW